MKGKSIINFAILAAGVVIFAEPALAFRCGSKLVTEGAHISKVLSICGNPTYRETRSILVSQIDPIQFGGRRIYRKGPDGLYVTPGHGPFLQEVTVTELTYNFGPSRLVRHLTFRNGYLHDIDEFGYGYRDHRR